MRRLTPAKIAANVRSRDKRKAYTYLAGVQQIPVDTSRVLTDEQEAIANAAIAAATMEIHLLKESGRVRNWSRREYELPEFSTSKSKAGDLLLRAS